MASDECCSNPPTLDAASGEGHVLEDLSGVKAYVVGPADAKCAVLLISDIFGFDSPNLRTTADKVAASGFLVVVPDLLYGDPFSRDNAERPLSVWIQSHSPDKAYEDIKPIIASLRNKGISAVGAAGYCWGAKVVVELAKSSEIEAAVLLHPSFVTVDDIKGVKCPISILGAESDQRSPPELVKQFEEALSSVPGASYFTKIFSGVSHGWAIRYSIDDTSAVRSAEEARQDTLDWFVKHVKFRI